MQRSVLLILITGATLAAACGIDGPSGVCTSELRVHFKPADTTILSGEAFTASVQLATYGGARRLSDVFAWQSENPSVAAVDSRTGQVLGQDPGETRIEATGESDTARSAACASRLVLRSREHTSALLIVARPRHPT